MCPMGRLTCCYWLFIVDYLIVLLSRGQCSDLD